MLAVLGHGHPHHPDWAKLGEHVVPISFTHFHLPSIKIEVQE